MRRIAAVGLLAGVLAASGICWAGARFLGGITYQGAEGVFFQKGPSDCGAAALKMIFENHGIRVSYDNLLAELATSPAGTSMLRLKQLSEARGFRCEGWWLTLSDLRRAPLPAILFVGGNHFTVLDSFTVSGEALIRDPSRGRMRVSPRRLATIWKGETLLFPRER
jgi:ABC-type bacteriocin/lantibiotic exporter with double-glycine peptidase domain